jgi:uncharacterized membrane protein (DUF485 family)
MSGSSREKETEKYVARQFRKSFSLGLFFLVLTLVLPILNQFAEGAMLRKLFGEMTVTYAYSVLLIYIVAWIITLYYVIRTDREEEAH